MSPWKKPCFRIEWRFVYVASVALVFTSAVDGQTITPKHSRSFTRYDDCEFVATQYADADSFCVRIREQEFVLRLYYVDAPESDERFPDRNAEQAQYFGITPAESLTAGKAARAFVSEFLAGKSFSVYTRWASALGSSKLPRYYAIIEVDGRGLAEVLVENGFARLHGTSVNYPDGTKAGAYITGLVVLEQTAKEQKVGAWANSRPQLASASIEEVAESQEVPPWVDRALFASGGAATVAVGWILHVRRLRRRSQ